MPDLIAQGAAPEHRWRRTLPAEQPCVLGRSAGFWSVPWDNRISRRHVELCWRDGRLMVQRIAGSTNPVFYCGREDDRFLVQPGERFVIGQTAFTLTDEQVSISLDAPAPAHQRTFSADYLKNVRFRDADARIDVLSRIPEIIAGADTDAEMFVRLISVLLTGVPHATAAAIVAIAGESDAAPVAVLHWDRRVYSERDFQPSDRLIRQALAGGQSVVHVWSGPAEPAAEPTSGWDGDWAFCTPIGGRACAGWALYLAGNFSTDAAKADAASVRALCDDLKFTELVATTLGSLRDLQWFERHQTSLRQFFSPVVLDALAGHDPDDVLRPQEADVSVLFCDLRGFARQSEQAADDLLGLLNRVSDALGVTTQQILAHGGVVGDFHGDAAMGFWGWPFAQADAPLRACRTALAIRAAFQAASRVSGHRLADFRMGIGIASGRAVAGKIGTVDQVKVTVFGPVVNLAARLEGMTKRLHAPILLDQATAAAVRRARSATAARVRRVAVVQPYGSRSAVEVSQLLPPAEEYPQLTDRHIATYESALDALLAGDWQRAFQLLHDVPAEDRVKDFLTVFIAQHNRTPPDDWHGVIPIESK